MWFVVAVVAVADVVAAQVLAGPDRLGAVVAVPIAVRVRTEVGDPDTVILFVGAVVVTLGYKLFQVWVSGGVSELPVEPAEAVDGG